MTNSEVLYRAADKVERDGWWNGVDDVEAIGSTCVALSIVDVCGDLLWPRFAAQDALMRYLGVADLPDIWEWNDAPGRTAAEVVETLRACAVIEQAKEQQPVEAVVS